MRLPPQIRSYDVERAQMSFDSPYLTMQPDRVTFIMKWGAVEGPFDIDKVPDWILEYFVQDQDAEFEIVPQKRIGQ